LRKTQTELYGVKGWLLLLCLLLTVLDPLVVLTGLFTQTQGASSTFDLHAGVFRLIVVQGVLAIALAVFSMYAGLSLWKITPNAVRMARYYLITEAAFSFVPFFLPAFLGVSDGSQKGTAMLYLLNALATTAYASAWYTYLSRSRRVRTTYSVPPEKKVE
jgi:hypothetical protein